MFIMGRPKTTKNETRTTVYLYEKDIIQEHLFNIKEKNLKNYINRLIKEDILRNGKEEIVKKYFKKETTNGRR